MFKVNNKNKRTTSMTSPSVSIDFEQVNVSWDADLLIFSKICYSYSRRTKITATYFFLCDRTDNTRYDLNLVIVIGKRGEI